MVLLDQCASIAHFESLPTPHVKWSACHDKNNVHGQACVQAPELSSTHWGGGGGGGGRALTRKGFVHVSCKLPRSPTRRRRCLGACACGISCLGAFRQEVGQIGLRTEVAAQI